MNVLRRSIEIATHCSRSLAAIFSARLLSFVFWFSADLIRFDETLMMEQPTDMNKGVVNTIQTVFPLFYFATHTHHHPTGARHAQLSESDYRLIVHVDAMPMAGTTDLAKHLRLGISTVSEGLGRLVNRGLIRRVASEDDARRRQFSLTAEGRRRLVSDSVLDPERIRDVLSSLTRQEIKVIGQAFELLRQGVTETVIRAQNE